MSALDSAGSAALLRAFERLDVDGSRRVDAAELVRVVERKLPDHEHAVAAVRDLIAEADSDGDGKIDYYEFCAQLAGELVPPASPADAAVDITEGTDSPWVYRPPPKATLPSPAGLLRPREKKAYRKPAAAVPTTPPAVVALPCGPCRELGSQSQPGCRECARTLRKAKAKTEQERVAVHSIRVVARRAADPAEGARQEPAPTREQLCRDRVLTERREIASWNVPLADAAGPDGEALLSGRPQFWVRHRPLCDKLVPPTRGDVLIPDKDPEAERNPEETATITAVDGGVVEVRWSDGSVGTLMADRIRLPLWRSRRAAQVPTVASAGKYRTEDQLQRTARQLTKPDVGFLSTCDSFGPLHPHPVKGSEPLSAHVTTQKQ